ncbi:MAG: peptidylprolyl isomerase [Candidatus Brocadiia bacterium]
MIRRIAVFLVLCSAILSFARAEQVDQKPVIAVPDFRLLPPGKIDDDEMGILAASMVMPTLEQKYRVLTRDDLLGFLTKKALNQEALFTDGKAVASLKEIGVSFLLMGVIEKAADKSLNVKMILFDVITGKQVAEATPTNILKAGDLPNACRNMSKDLLEKANPPVNPPVNGKEGPLPVIPDQPVNPEVAALEKAEITVTTSAGSFTIRLYPREAPVTVQNFIRLCRIGYYKDAFVHRVIKDFIVQMGATNRDGTGDPGYSLNNEFNAHPHVRGAVAMARDVTQKELSHAAQFFVMLVDYHKLDRSFTVFGHVVKGMEVLDAIGNSPVGKDPKQPYFPDEEIKILDVKVAETAEPFAAPAMLPPMISLADKGVIVAEVTTEGYGKFSVYFYPDKAPKLVANFIELAQKHFYDGLIWHRVIRDFVIQTGDPEPDNPEVEEPPYRIREEPSDLKHVLGALAAAKSQEEQPINSSSQFYICLSNQPDLDGKYTVFGQVFEGLEVLAAIGRVATEPQSNRPIKDVVITSIVVKNLGNIVPPWQKNDPGTNLVPAAENTPHAKIVAVIATDLGDIKIRFYADQSPLTVANFVGLARKGFYDGMYVHRVVRDFIVQFGDPSTNGQAEPPTIANEKNKLSNLRGTVSMANRGPDTATCQYFINLADNLQFDGSYAVFAEVIEGLDIVEKLSRLEVTPGGDAPKDKVFFSVKLMTKGN